MAPTTYPGRQFNRTFRGCEPTNYNACVGNNGQPSYTEYADGFCDAAMHLIDIAIERQTMDELIYPICFNMRHAIELRLKQYVFALEWMRDSVRLDEFRDTQLHDLSEIWDYYANKAAEVDKRLTSKLSELEPIVADFAEIDPTGQTFRYPYSAEKGENNKHLVDVGIINVVNLKNIFIRLSQLLQDVHDLNNSLHCEYRTGTYTKKLSRAELSEIAAKLPHYSFWKEDLDTCLEAKKKIRLEYGITSTEFGRAKTLIESNYEMAAEIGLELPLKYATVCDWLTVYKAHLNTESGKPASSTGLCFPSSDTDMQEIASELRRLNEAVIYCMGHISIEAFLDIACVYECGRHGDYCEFYIQAIHREIRLANTHLKNTRDRKEYIRHIVSKTNFVRCTLKGLRMLKQNSILGELSVIYGLEGRC